MAPESLSVPEPQPQAKAAPSEAGEPQFPAAKAQVTTTTEELKGFHIIRAIVRGIVPTKRIFMRDAQSYCAILLDDNNRKPICRLRFNNSEKLGESACSTTRRKNKSSPSRHRMTSATLPNAYSRRSRHTPPLRSLKKHQITD